MQQVRAKRSQATYLHLQAQGVEVMPELVITGSLLVEFDLMDLWSSSIEELVSCNYSLCDVEVDDIMEA